MKTSVAVSSLVVHHVEAVKGSSLDVLVSAMTGLHTPMRFAPNRRREGHVPNARRLLALEAVHAERTPVDLFEGSGLVPEVQRTAYGTSIPIPTQSPTHSSAPRAPHMRSVTCSRPSPIATMTVRGFFSLSCSPFATRKTSSQ